jgi:hypothetical protein
LKKEYSVEPLHGLEEKTLFVYFKLNLQQGTLKTELTERQCAFLINLMSDTHKTEVSYEQFLDFVIPRTKKKITKRLITKIKQQPMELCNNPQYKCKYDSVCTLAKLFECEIQIMKKIQKQVARFYTIRANFNKDTELQISELF